MDLQASTLWWLGAGLLVAAELATGTFYLLMMALGLASGALATHLGLATTAQIVTAALVGGGATAVWHWRRARAPRSAPFQSNRDANLDIGEAVHVDRWAADRSTHVSYRGSTWSARLAPGSAATPGEHRVVAVEGNWLVLAPLPPATVPAA